MYKKILFIFVGIFTLLLTSCSIFNRPELDLDVARKNLENNGYNVSYYKDDEVYSTDELYASKSANDMSFDTDYYTLKIIVFKDYKTAKYCYEELKLERDSEIDELTLNIKRWKHIIDKYEDDMYSHEINSINDVLKEYEKELDELKNTQVIGRIGKIVWFGDAQAVYDSKN